MLAFKKQVHCYDVIYFLIIGGVWRSGDGWFTGISRAKGKIEYNQQLNLYRKLSIKDTAECCLCIVTHIKLTKPPLLQIGAKWGFRTERLPWP